MIKPVFLSILQFITLQSCISFTIIPNQHISYSSQPNILLPSIKTSTTKTTTSLSLSSAENNNEEPKKLILGEDFKNLGTDYLSIAKKRNEEAKKKMQEQLRLEEEAAERKRREKMNNPGNNYGPTDFSTFVGFGNDGFEDAEGNEDEGGWGSDIGVGTGDEGDSEGEPSLLLDLFGDDDIQTTDSGLIF